VLNEGVDVPDARIAIVLSGTGSTREYIQRLGRVLRKGRDDSKLALLYEVVAEATTEEGTVRRRQPQPLQHPRRQLELLPTSKSFTPGVPRAAENTAHWDAEFTDEL
jgi:superfamily II DNA or RNA helicase